MTPEALRRLRRRLLALLAVAVAVAIAVPVALLVAETSDRRHEQLDTRVLTAVRDVASVVGESADTDGEVDVETYTQTPRAPETPLTAVADADGEYVAGDRTVPAALLRLAVRRARGEREDPVTAPSPDGDVRLAAVELQGEDGPIGTALGYAPVAPVRDDVRAVVVRAAAASLAGWLLVCGAAFMLIGRALRPAGVSVAREQAFLADAAHELRTPWAVVRGRVEQAQRDGVRDEDLQVLAQTATQAGDTITDMLELARLDAGRGLGDVEPLRLDALVATCVDERAEHARRRAVRVTAELDEDVRVRGDVRLLSRAVGNLLDNALTHGGAGGTLRVSVRRAGDAAIVVVQDSGPGVPPGQADRIFDRFQRGSGAAAGGAGLGLPIAKLVAEAHGGTLIAQGDGPGARFVLTLDAL
ncbi:sensor histidine kinase [Paraconexibacter sp.]|uniref:sensor histidine kinase n=1 Tax=Paraconexibacter sp. TaxID=2949640 RepID=UPI00356A562B